MWTIFLLLSLINVQFAQSSQEKQDSSRIMVQGPGLLRNYTISFVPLLAVLAQFIPKLQPTITTTTQARKLEVINAWEETSLCQLSKIKSWPNLSDECEFYSCAINASLSADCSQQIYRDEQDLHAVKVGTIPLKQCFFLQVYRCTQKYSFNKVTGKCEACNNNSFCCQ